MRLATLIVNPVARQAGLLQAQLAAIVELLAEHDYMVSVVETTSAVGSSRELAAEATETSRLVLACGGDGTVHGVVQGLAHSDAVLGVVPLGTANALARNLRIPLNPIAAVTRLLSYKPRRIPLGEIATAAGTSLFALMAGCGPDGLLIHELSSAGGARLKARFGRAAYYGHAARLFFTRRWPKFDVEFRVDGEWSKLEAIAVMASRVGDLGGVFSGTTRQANMTDARLHIQVLRGPAWLSLPAWMMGIRNPWVQSMNVDELRCTGADVYAQADAEPMGRLPMRLRVVPDALWLLMGE